MSLLKMEAKLQEVIQDVNSIQAEIGRLQQALTYRQSQLLELNGAKNVLESILHEAAEEEIEGVSEGHEPPVRGDGAEAL
jgi:prefoldin subunit 5